MLYTKSRRPITDMSLFRRPSNHYIPKSSIEINDNKLSVARYARGMSKGVFFKDERPSDVCGFFYYVEPESLTYLICLPDRAKNYFNKTHAYNDLITRVDNSDDKYYVDRGTEMHNDATPKDHSESILPKNLIMSPIELADYTLGEVDNDVQDIPQYAGWLLDYMHLKIYMINLYVKWATKLV